MKKYISMALLFFALVGCATSSDIVPKDYKLPAYKEIHLDNGMRLLFLPDPGVPYLSMSMMIPKGYTEDPMTKSGLANIVAGMLDKGSTKRKAAKIADDLDFLGIQFGADVSAESTSIQINGLSKFNQEIVGSFGELVLSPMFRGAELDPLKKRTASLISKSKDQPKAMASRYAKTYLFGNHPYAKSSIGEANDVGSIDLSDVNSYYKATYVPEGAVLAVVGQYSESLKQQIITQFSGWKGKATAKAVFPKIKGPKDIQIRLVTKPSLKQAQVRLVHLGPTRDVDEFLSLRMATTILGGSFSSRLMDEIRDNRGLTYGIRSSFSFGREMGAFEISSFTRLDKVGELIAASLEIYKNLYENGISEEELKRAKALTLGRFPKALETPEKLAANLLILRSNNIGDDYLKDFVRNVERVSLSDINKAIRKYMKPEDIKVLVYAPEAGVKEQLEKISLLEIRKAK